MVDYKGPKLTGVGLPSLTLSTVDEDVPIEILSLTSSSEVFSKITIFIKKNNIRMRICRTIIPQPILQTVKNHQFSIPVLDSATSLRR